jgi:hypothetical protein
VLLRAKQITVVLRKPTAIFVVADPSPPTGSAMGLRVRWAIYRTLSARYKKGHERLTDFRQIETRCLPCCTNRTVLLKLLDHAVEVGIAGAKAPCEPASTTLDYPLAVSDNLELTVLSRSKDGFNAESILD